MEFADPELVINFTATEMPLTVLAEIFNLLFPDQILIPASKGRTLITTKEVMREIKVGELIERIGLVIPKAPLVGRAMKDIKPAF